MKIALLTDGIYPYVIGGMQKHSFLLVKYLAKNKVFVDLYHTNKSDFNISKLELFTEEEKQYINSIVIEFPDIEKMPGHYIRESFEYSLRIFNTFSKNTEVDFIYAKGFSAWKLLDEKRKGYKCAPVGINFHGYEMFQRAASFKSKFEQLFLFRKPVLFNVNNADFVFSYGGKITDIILNLGVDRKRIIELTAAIEDEWIIKDFHSIDNSKKFVFVGRYERRKGFEEICIVLKQLLLKHDFEFHFIGAIPENKKIFSNKIIYHGQITDSNKMKILLQSMDVLVCPSYSEGMPNVILEAMASGLAVIATDVGAVNLMVNNENGWLLNSPEVTMLNLSIEQAINLSANELNLMKKKSVSKVEGSFVWSQIAKQTIAEIRRVANSVE